MDGGHHLSSGIERNFTRTRLTLDKLALFKSERFGVIDERNLVRLAGALSVCLNLGIGAKSHCRGKRFFVACVVVNNGHNVLGEGSGLIGADNLSTAERFNGSHLADYCVLFGHVGNAYCKNDCHNGNKSLRYSRNGKRNGRDERAERNVNERRLIGNKEEFCNKVKGKNENADADNDFCKNL